MSNGQSVGLINRNDFDDVFAAGVKPWRDIAQAAGLDMSAFDVRISSKKAMMDEHVANISYDRKMQSAKATKSHERPRMTNEETIDMAKQCGHWSGQTVEMNDVGVLRFAEMIAERCAKKCDDNALKLGAGLGNTALRVTAMDIRAGRV